LLAAPGAPAGAPGAASKPNQPAKTPKKAHTGLVQSAQAGFRPRAVHSDSLLGYGVAGAP